MWQFESSKFQQLPETCINIKYYGGNYNRRLINTTGDIWQSLLKAHYPNIGSWCPGNVSQVVDAYLEFMSLRDWSRTIPLAVCIDAWLLLLDFCRESEDIRISNSILVTNQDWYQPGVWDTTQNKISILYRGKYSILWNFIDKIKGEFWEIMIKLNVKWGPKIKINWD